SSPRVTATPPAPTRSPATWPRWRPRCRRSSRRFRACRCPSSSAASGRSATKRTQRPRSNNPKLELEDIMALMERVSALIRANLNDLIDKAEDPEKMLKQVILDMENQLIQVKTQVAMAIADEHLLGKKQKENEAKIAEWSRKAELAVDRNDDALARAALERAESGRQIASALDEQLADQKAQVESLRNAYRRLEEKLHEARAKCD